MTNKAKDLQPQKINKFNTEAKMNIYVGNISYDVSENDLKKAF